MSRVQFARTGAEPSLALPRTSGCGDGRLATYEGAAAKCLSIRSFREGPGECSVGALPASTDRRGNLVRTREGA